MKTCKFCGHEMADNAKVCPQCGGKNKKVWYKRPSTYIWAVVILLIAGLFGGGSSEKDKETTETPLEVPEKEEVIIEYIPTDITTLYNELEKNALVAEQTYQDAYIEITGILSVIDSDGSYISLRDNSYNSITCSIENNEQLNVVMTKSKGDTVTVRGQISSIGEIMGYNLDIAEIE